MNIEARFIFGKEKIAKIFVFAGGAAARLFAHRNLHVFRHLRPQGIEIRFFRFRIINRSFRQARPATDRFEAFRAVAGS